MKSGSIAIALIAEYGDCCAGAISLIGSSCSTRWPAPASHAAIGTRSGDLADAPARRRRDTRRAAAATPARRRPIRSRSPRLRHAGEPADHGRQRLIEDALGRQQADDEKRLAREIEEVAGMDEDAVGDRAGRGRDPPRSRASAPAARRSSRPRRRARGRRARPPRCHEGAGRSRATRALNLRRRRARPRSRSSAAAACTGVETERYVSQTSSSRSSATPTSASGPATAIHPSFTCGSPADFDSPPSEKTSTSRRSSGRPAARRGARRRARSRRTPRRRSPPRRARPRSARPRSSSSAFTNDPVGLFGLTSRMARVRVADVALETVEIDRPRAVVVEVVRPGRHRVEPRQVVEQRIARPRHQHLVARIGQQLEEQRVRLARAGGEDDAIGGSGDAAPRVVGGDGLPRLRQAERLRLVLQPARVGQRRQQIRRDSRIRRGSGWWR